MTDRRRRDRPTSVPAQAVRKAEIRLADGRALMYFGDVPERPAEYPDLRRLAAVQVQSRARWDQLLGEWIVIAGHRHPVRRGTG